MAIGTGDVAPSSQSCLSASCAPGPTALLRITFDYWINRCCSTTCERLKHKKAIMLQSSTWPLTQLLLFVVTAAVTHLVVSLGQTLMHCILGHHPIGGPLFHNHINFHHTFYSKDHLVSQTYLGDGEGNNTPFFFIPVFLVGGCAYFFLPITLFVVMVIVCAASFYAHVYLDKEYHVEGSQLQRFAWFRKKQALHFVHHQHAKTNFAVIHFFWDRILGTYRNPQVSNTIAVRSFAQPSNTLLSLFPIPDSVNLVRRCVSYLGSFR
jgi:sterol desaturase/sphingolipid hydroxylase (fatty acid hydroxylase superfamily)